MRLCSPALLLLLCTLNAQAQTDFLTFTGVWTNVPVTGLSSPTGITGDAAGNLYFTAASSTSIIKLAPSGVQTTIGSGLFNASGIAIDSSGTLYATSNDDNKVYQITAGGTQTLVGSGWNLPLSVAVDSTGNVYVTDASGLSKVTAGGTQSLLVSAIALQGLAVDLRDNVYYGDTNNNRVFEIPFGSTTPTPHNVANSVRNLYLDPQGTVYMAETFPGVQRSDDSFGDKTTFGDTAVTEAVWGNGQNLYLADSSGIVEKVALGAVDFGSVNLCPNGNTITPCTATQTLHFALDSNVSGSATARAVTQGTVGLDYAITGDSCTGALSSGGACTLAVTFTPGAPGVRVGAAQAVGQTTVNLIADPVGPQPQALHPTAAPRPMDQPPGTLLTSVLLHGIGLGPIGVFNTAPIETYSFTALSASYLYGVITSADGSAYITDYHNCVIQRQFNNTTTVVAGSVCGVSQGDGGPATSASLVGPTRTVLDGAGNLFISEYDGYTIRRVDGATGIISTVAGNGSYNYTGDGGLATNATFRHPSAIALDASGNLFIADQSNEVVRRVDALTGIITTIAGNGTPGYSGDGGPATSAQLHSPDALAFDGAGNLYIADDTNNVIRKLAAGVITTIAGTGSFGYSGDGGPATSAQLGDPEGVSVDPAGNVYIADSSNFLVRKVDVSTGIITTAAGTYNGRTQADERYTGDGGPAIQAGLSYDEDVFVDSSGVLLIADSDNHVIRIVLAPVGAASFGSVALGSSSTAQAVHMGNAGTSSLTLNALQIPANYSLVAADTTCTPGIVLAVNADCVFSLQLMPTADGSLNSVLVITDDLLNQSGATQSIVLAGTGTGAAPAKLAFAAAIPAIVAGGNAGVVAVDIEAADSSLATGATGLVTLTITGPGGYSHILTVPAVNGVATFDLTSLPLTSNGVYSLTATSTGLAQALANATVIPNTLGPAQLAIPSSVTRTIPAGSSPGVVPVNIENSSGTVVAGATGNVTLTISGPGGYSHVVTVAASNGVATFDLSALALTAPGVYTLAATSSELAPAMATVTVTSGSPSTPVQLAIAGSLPAIVPSGASLGIVPVDINNAFGAVATGAANTVTLTITGPGGFSHVVTVAAVNGVASFDLSALPLNATGTYTLTATSDGLTQAQATVTVTEGAVTTTPVQLAIPPSVPAMVASGGNLGIVPVDINNSSGMVIPGATNTVTLTITGPGGFTYTATVTAVNGVASFDLSSVPLSTPGTYTLTATSGRLAQALASVTVSTDFTIAVTSSSQATVGPIAPGTATTFSFTLAPASGDFPASITLTATGLPPGSTYSFAPASVTPGTGSVATALAIQTSRTASAALAQPLPGLWGWGTLALGLLLLPVSGSRRMRTAFRRTPLVSVALLLLALGSVAGFTGCGAGGLFGHPQQSYTITVTGISGSIHHSATVTLSVE